MLKSDSTNKRFLNLLACVERAQTLFAGLLESNLARQSTTIEQYVRYLSFQYHLTKDVQRYFLAIAAHPDLARRRRLRTFLVNFANEEELHYLVAANDLYKIGNAPLPISLDVQLWHSFFRSVVHERPFLRLGAATVLENIADGVAKPSVKKALQGVFLNKDNTKFLVLHQHEALPHGDQILDAIESAKLDDSHFEDLIEGACVGTVLYLRMAEWALEPNSLASLPDRKPASMTAREVERIQNFQMDELKIEATT